MKSINKIEIYNLIKNSGINIFFLHFDTCPYCIKAKPIIIDVEKQLNSKANFYWLNADTEDFWEEKTELSIEVVPTVFVYNNGKQIFRQDTKIVASDILAAVNSADGQ